MVAMSAVSFVSLTASVVSALAADVGAYQAKRDALLQQARPDRTKFEQSAPSLFSPKDDMRATVELDEDGQPRKMGTSVSLSEIARALRDKADRKKPGVVDFWIEGRHANTGEKFTGETEADVLYLGTTVRASPAIKFGAVAQIDKTEQVGSAASHVSSDGYMAGPYANVRLGEGVVWESRGGWGENQIDAPTTGAVTDQTRLSTKVVGKKAIGGGWHVSPEAAFSFSENATSYDAYGVTAVNSAGSFSVTPRLSKQFSTESGTTIEPKFGVGAAVPFEDLDQLDALAAGTADADLRMQAEAGVAVGLSDGAKLEATGRVEGVENADAFSGRLNLRVPLGH